MKVAVIGSNGFMGKNLCNVLRNYKVKILEFSSSLGGGINSITGNLPENFCFTESIDALIYMAQSPFFREMPQKAGHLLSVNQISAVEAAIAAINAGAKLFIYMSTGSVYAPSFAKMSEDSELDRKNWYALSKIHAEECLSLLSKEIKIINVRPFGVFGPSQTDRLVPNIIRNIKNKTPIMIYPKSESLNDDGLAVSLIFVDDASYIIKHLLFNGGPDVINIGGPEPYSLKYIAEKIGKLMDIKPIFELKTKPRNSDLIADISMLNKIMKPQFHSFEKALSITLKSY